MRNPKMQVLDLIEAKVDRLAHNAIDRYYPEKGPLRRELYGKHMEFFWAGSIYRERCAICANRVGKTEGMGGYETALHLTGSTRRGGRGGGSTDL
jgi:hypothetical protein